MIAKLIFIYFAITMIVTSILVITRKSTIHSVLWMLILFVHIAALYLFLNAEFLAAIQIIVYAGAILVLFLFIILLLNLRNEDNKNVYQKQWPFSIVIGVILTIFFIITLSWISIPIKGSFTEELVQSEGILSTISSVLYSEYLLPFEIASVILLVAIIGAVVLAKKNLTK